MTQYGSLVNTFMGSRGVVPEVGMGVTIVHWSDRSAGTVTWVSPSGKTIRYRGDRAIRTDSNGMSEAQSYRYEQIPDGHERTARLTKRGWRDKGVKIVLGVRDAYYDYTF